MSSIATDEANTVLTILSGGWSSANTDSVTPSFKLIYDVKRIPEDVFRTYDYVLAYQGMRNVAAGAIGKVDKEVVRVTIDIRSDGAGQTSPRTHALKVRDEVLRLIRAQYGNRIASKYDVIRITGETDLTDKSKMLYRHVIDVELRAYNVT